MSLQHGKLCYLLLTEHFGEVVAKVAENLKWGPKPLSYIISSTGLSSTKVKKALSVLIQYGFVLFKKGIKIAWVAEYMLIHEKVLLILRYPKYLSLIKSKFGVEAQLLLEEIFKHGSITGSNAILKAFKRFKDDSSDAQNVTLITLRNNLHTLISNNFLMRCAYPSSEETQEEGNNVPTLSVKESELFKSPELNMKILSDIEAGKTSENPGDSGVYWKVNFDRFNQDMRDEVMINAMRRRFDDNAADLMKYLLQLMYLRTDAWAGDSNPVPIIELKELITKKSGNQYLIQYFEQYIKIMEEDSSQFISRTSETSSSQVIVNLSKAFHQLSCTAIENIVDQRFGSKASRIFRLVCAKKYIEQDQIQQLAMITDKEAKQITYKLLQENFIQMQELRKPTAGSGPNKSFFLFHVDINLVVDMMIGICHKATFNALTRRQSERNEHKRLIDKHERIESVIKSMREQGEASEEQLNEYIEEWIPPPERSLLESVEKMMEKLQLAEIQIDTSLFLLQLFRTTYFETNAYTDQEIITHVLSEEEFFYS